MTFHPARNVYLRLPKAALLSVFQECDQFDDDETGGRVLGSYRREGEKLHLDIQALIDSGPRARRSAVSFFQDGDYQERVFRQIEARHPHIEHLGNWHTHHMNGLQHLSSGDLQTYHRTVNHPQHNTPFFYALLVTTKHASARDPLSRYSVKHYLFQRNDPNAYEIPASHVELTDAPLLSASGESAQHAPAVHTRSHSAPAASAQELAQDQLVLAEFFPGVQPFQSAKLGLYWRGPLRLANGQDVEVVVTQDGSRHTATLRNLPAPLEPVAEVIAQTELPSARAALIHAERTCNAALCAPESGWFKRKKRK